MNATETRQFTVEDMEEIRPGVFKLKGHHVYAAHQDLKETCEACNGKGKVQGSSSTGRKTWMHCPCNRGRGRFGETNPLNNIMRSLPRTGGHTQSMAKDLEGAVEDLNNGVHVFDFEKHPILVYLWG
jgi:hypothetical protein